VEVINSSNICEIANLFSAKEYRFVHQEKFTGYRHMFDFYSEEKRAIRIFVLSDRQIAVDGKVYEASEYFNLDFLIKFKNKC
jgi:hypothetical protein